MKTLMVDFDGVLHPTRGGQFFSRLPLLETALSGHECDIVISSSWRDHHIPEPFDDQADRGFSIGAAVSVIDQAAWGLPVYDRV